MAFLPKWKPQWTGMLMLAFYALAVSLFGSDFAEINLQLPFLGFPIFIGEILLFLCLFLWIGTIAFAQPFTRGHIAIIFYVLWVLVFALIGYKQYGAFALRNAALFYYPLFAFLAFSFFDSKFFSERLLFPLILILYAFSWFFSLNHFAFTWWVLAFILIRKYYSRLVVLPALFVLLSWNYRAVFEQSRTGFLGLVGGLVFLGFVVLRLVDFKRQKSKILIFGGTVIFFCIATLAFMDRNSLISLVDFRHLIATYQGYKGEISRNEKDFVAMSLTPNVYVDNRKQRQAKEAGEQEKLEQKTFKTFVENVVEGITGWTSEEHGTQQSGDQRQVKTGTSGNLDQKQIASRETKIEIPPDSQSQAKAEKDSSPNAFKPEWRSLEGAYVNSIFRILIWEDMLKELKEHRAIFGLGFGWPQRSRNLEILGWGLTEWQRDGWITPHNSYFHMIYRAGIIGILIVFIIFWSWWKLAVFFIRRSSWTGIMLCVILVYWLTSANFLLILELPYYAIPFWTIFGIAFGHKRDLSEAR